MNLLMTVGPIAVYLVDGGILEEGGQGRADRIYWVFIIKVVGMNKLKTIALPARVRPKSPLPSPTNRKSTTKTREKVERPSPKASRIQPADPQKTSPLKRPKMSLVIDQPLQQHMLAANSHSCGYETPKFKFQVQQAKSISQNAYNFFSFGEREVKERETKQKEGKEKSAAKTGNKQNMVRRKDTGGRLKQGYG